MSIINQTCFIIQGSFKNKRGGLDGVPYWWCGSVVRLTWSFPGIIQIFFLPCDQFDQISFLSFKYYFAGKLQFSHIFICRIGKGWVPCGPFPFFISTQQWKMRQNINRIIDNVNNSLSILWRLYFSYQCNIIFCGLFTSGLKFLQYIYYVVYNEGSHLASKYL